jgi:hypothetical protein
MINDISSREESVLVRSDADLNDKTTTQGKQRMDTEQFAQQFREYCFTWERVRRELESQGKSTNRDEIDRMVADEMKKPRT